MNDISKCNVFRECVWQRKNLHFATCYLWEWSGCSMLFLMLNQWNWALLFTFSLCSSSFLMQVNESGNTTKQKNVRLLKFKVYFCSYMNTHFIRFFSLVLIHTHTLYTRAGSMQLTTRVWFFVGESLDS